MQEERIEGIVLRSMEYKEQERIITLFTGEGLLNLIVKGISRKKPSLLSLTTPFCRAEFVYARKNSDLLKFLDGTILDEHLLLRHQLSHLKAAGCLAQAILFSQLPEKPSPLLYALFSSYLKHVTHFQDPSGLIASFHLKMLSCEGLISLTEHCSLCPAAAQCLEKGESFCLSHAPTSSHFFSSEEWDYLNFLAKSRRFSDLQHPSSHSEIYNKILTYFKQRIIDI